jgi:hypothetical protein
MHIRPLSGQFAPLVLLVVSGVWMAVTIVPVFYSGLLPKADFERIVRGLEDKEAMPGDLAALARATDSAGRLKRAILVGAYWGASAERAAGESHTTKTTELSYLAWFENRPKPTILILGRTEIDGSLLRYTLNEGSPLSTLRVYLVPSIASVFSMCWFVRRRSRKQKDEAISADHFLEHGGGS